METMTCLRIDGIHTQKNYCRLILECMWVSFFFNMNLVLDIIKKNDDDVFLFYYYYSFFLESLLCCCFFDRGSKSLH